MKTNIKEYMIVELNEWQVHYDMNWFYWIYPSLKKAKQELKELQGKFPNEKYMIVKQTREVIE